MRIKVIGVGGIGTALLPPLTRYLNFATNPSEMELTLIDGDRFEAKNRERQHFDNYGNKAEIVAARLRRDFECLNILVRPEFVIPDNVYSLIGERDVIFMGVDNHASRKLISNRCDDLDNVLLISGGNFFTDGNVQVYWRRDGEDQTLPLDNEFHPEIANPRDKNPGEVGCGELAESVPQLIFTNNAIAAQMLSAFYAWSVGKLNFDEVYVDIVTGNVRSVRR